MGPDAATHDTYSFFNSLNRIPHCAIIHIKYQVENGSNMALESHSLISFKSMQLEMRPIVLDICRKMDEHGGTSNSSKEQAAESQSPDVFQIRIPSETNTCWVPTV